MVDRDLLVALKALRSLIRDLGVQDADDHWNEAVARADAAIANAEGATLAGSADPVETK